MGQAHIVTNAPLIQRSSTKKRPQPSDLTEPPAKRQSVHTTHGSGVTIKAEPEPIAIRCGRNDHSLCKTVDQRRIYAERCRRLMAGGVASAASTTRLSNLVGHIQLTSARSNLIGTMESTGSRTSTHHTLHAGKAIVFRRDTTRSRIPMQGER